MRVARRVRAGDPGKRTDGNIDTAPGIDPTVDCALTLKRLYVFFVIEVGTRYVHILAVTANPGIMDHAADPEPMDLGERAGQFKVLIRDRAGQFTTAFDAVLADTGITVCKIPPRSPRANAYAERFVATVGSEVTDRMRIFGERHLRRVLSEYARHYNGWRPHRALDLQPPRSDRPEAMSIDGTWPLTWWTKRGRIRTAFSLFRGQM